MSQPTEKRKLTAQLPVIIYPPRSLPLPYHEIGTLEIDGRKTRAGVSINLAALYLFIDQQIVCVPMEGIINQLMPQLLEMPVADGYIFSGNEDTQIVQVGEVS